MRHGVEHVFLELRLHGTTCDHFLTAAVDAATPRRAETMGRKRQNKPSPRDQLRMELERRLGPGRLELELGSFCCGFGSLRIDEEAVANDKRILAHVSWGEARTYIRGVNAHHEKGTRRYRRLEAQYDRNGRSDDPKKLRQQYDEQVLAGGPLRDWLDDHSAMQCAEAATPVEVKADVAEE